MIGVGTFELGVGLPLAALILYFIFVAKYKRPR
jgi:hypothetical protein